MLLGILLDAPLKQQADNNHGDFTTRDPESVVIGHIKCKMIRQLHEVALSPTKTTLSKLTIPILLSYSPDIEHRPVTILLITLTFYPR